jgi:hypothetical protein
MEWLDSSRWTPEVQKAVLAQLARVHPLGTPASGPPASVPHTAVWGARLARLLRDSPRLNPWGHPN